MLNTAFTMLFGIFPASACNCAYVKVNSDTVPGAVATGSVAPGSLVPHPTRIVDQVSLSLPVGLDRAVAANLQAGP
jgi:hypothetical protein